MDKFKIGDKVRILDGRKIPDISPYWVEEMNEYIGTIQTIDYADALRYGVVGIDYYFTEEWLVPADVFTKADFKEFDIVEFRNGSKTLVIRDAIVNALSVGSYYLASWTDDLRDIGGMDIYDIMKVYRPIDSLSLDKSKWGDLPVVYERTEVKEMTVEEISKALGYEVKVVR